MKATSRNSFAKRSLSIAATALPLLCAGLANAQTAAPAPAPAVPGVPASIAPASPPTGPMAAPIAGSNAPVAGTPVAAPAVVTPSATEAPAPPTVPAAPVDPMAEKYKHIDMGVWLRVGAALQKPSNPKKLDGFGTGGEVELHFSNQMRKSLLWTANFVAGFGAPDGGSFHGGGGGGVTGNATVLDLIAQYEPDDAFHLWVGRMLVASDRSNFSGPYFMAPWIYPLFLGPQGNPYAIVGPQEGPSGRNDGATVWGQVQGGLFKYYLGVYRGYDAGSPAGGGINNKPLFSGRLSLSLLNPEPGYYGSSTYYGMDLLGIGVGGQYSKNQDPNPAAADGASDYGLFNADILYEKNLGASGVVDVEGAFYKYVGDRETMDWSHFGLVSYLTPDTAIGKLQPLVRLQQAIFKNNAPTVSQIDAQVSDVIDSYSTRLTLGFTHASVDGGPKSNAIFAGVQLQK
jgi:hypothetical protein